MIRYDEGGKDFRQLLYDLNGNNTQIFDWLVTLGLDKIYTKELVKELVENGILQYCLRVDLPEEFFIAWEGYPVISERMKSMPDSLFWCTWYDEESSSSLDFDQWYMYPYDQSIKDPDLEYFLNQAVQSDSKFPEPITHPNGHKIQPQNSFSDIGLDTIFVIYYRYYISNPLLKVSMQKQL